MGKNKEKKCNLKCNTCEYYNKSKDFCKEKEIEVEFASALVMPNTMSKLKRVSLDIQNSCKLQAELFSNSFSGKRFFVKENKTMKKRSVVIPPYSAYGAGIRFTTKAPISINSLEFEFDVRGK